jgi:hypothetical protein
LLPLVEATVAVRVTEAPSEMLFEDAASDVLVSTVPSVTEIETAEEVEPLNDDVPA